MGKKDTTKSIVLENSLKQKKIRGLSHVTNFVSCS